MLYMYTIQSQLGVNSHIRTCMFQCTTIISIVHVHYMYVPHLFSLNYYPLLPCPPLSSLISLADLPVTVMEYTGPLDSLSSRDVDQKLLNSRLEECSVCVDTSVMRLLETVLSTNKTRCQRDLGKHLAYWESVGWAHRCPIRLGFCLYRSCVVCWSWVSFLSSLTL